MSHAAEPASADFRFGTKGETLERLAKLLGREHFVAQHMFTVDEWRADADAVIRAILDRFAGVGALAVRSSAASEDRLELSMAGVYTSVTSVAPRDDHIRRAVSEVIASYDDDHPGHHVLVQPMIERVALAGVVLTRDLDTGGPYYVVNYDDVTGRTDTVTGGHGENKCVLIRRDHADSLHSPRIRGLLRIVREAERVSGSDELDIEFCIDASDAVFILQVRPLAARRNWTALDDAEVHRAVQTVKRDFTRHNQPHAGLAGPRTAFGEMPDWNPAEMIGNCPKPLALSLYQHLITDAAWATARRNLGYLPVNAGPLLIPFSGRPYIDVRLSLNSFLPAGIDPDFAHELVEWQLGLLAAHRELHDKIEFEIAATCRDLGFARYRQRLAGAGFAAHAVETFGGLLRRLTARCIAAEREELAARYAVTRGLASGAQRLKDLPAKQRALRLLAECIDHGVVPFAELARHAFIGMAFLKSAVARGAIGPDSPEQFIKSLHTVAGDLAQDMYLLSRGEIGLPAFLERYGHLRPGTYDIASWRYDENPGLYLSGSSAEPAPRRDFAFPPGQKRALERLLREEGYEFDLETLARYVAQAVRFREAAKFEFTRNVSHALQAIAAWGEGLGLGRDDLAYLRIEEIGRSDDRALLGDAVAAARERYQVTRALRLPHLILSEDDIEVVRLPLGRPNFITGKTVIAPVRLIRINEAPVLEGEIVLIESADPGFDWIFSRGIRGLITKYGGANSHMAIRCAEFDLPAAIGCGERMFEMVARAHAVELNCSACTIRPVR